MLWLRSRRHPAMRAAGRPSAYAAAMSCDTADAERLRHVRIGRVPAGLVLATPRCLRLDNGTHIGGFTVQSVARYGLCCTRDDADALMQPIDLRACSLGPEQHYEPSRWDSGDRAGKVRTIGVDPDGASEKHR